MRRRVVLAASFGLTLCVSIAPAAAAHEGWGIVRDRHGRLYVADIPANVIWRITRDRRFTPVLRGIHSHALSIDAEGNVYGTHTDGQERFVWRLSTSDQLIRLVSGANAQALDLQAFLRGADGAVYTASRFQFDVAPEHRALHLIRWREGGIIDTIVGGALGRSDGRGTAGRFEQLLGMALDSDGTIVVADGPWLRRVDPSGAVQTIAGPLTVSRWGQDLLGVGVGGNSSIFVADFIGRRVLLLRGGTVSQVTDRQWYWAPTGVLSAPEGLYVLEHPRAPLGMLGDLRVGPYLRVRLVDGEGRSTVVGTRWGDRSATFGGAALLLLGGIGFLITRRRREG